LFHVEQKIFFQRQAFAQELKKSAQLLPRALFFEEQERLVFYYVLLLEGNQRMNLTAITEPVEAVHKHIVDSLTLALFLPQVGSLVDVGSGAGLPGLPLAVVCPQLSFSLLDSLAKRCNWLAETSEALGLKNTKIINSRAEAAGQNKNLRESFDGAFARAVAALPVLAEYLLPLVKVGGFCWAMKGPEAEKEVAEAANALKILGGKVQQIYLYNLASGETRSIIVIEKVAETPDAYPRREGRPKKQPL